MRDSGNGEEGRCKLGNQPEWHNNKEGNVYTWVIRANARQKREMQEIVDAWNECAHEDIPDLGFAPEYALEYYRGYQFVVRHEGQVAERGSFVRCGKCGTIRELLEGQVRCCDECGDRWD